MVEIRVLTVDDAAQYRALRHEALQTDPWAFGFTYEWEATKTLSWYMELLHQYLAIGAFIDQKLVGMSHVTRSREIKLRHRAAIWFAYVTPTHRRKGIARLLTEACHQQARRLGISQCTASILASNHAMRDLYAKLGYEETHTERNAMKHDRKFHDVVHVIRYFDDPATMPLNLFETLIQIPHLTLPIEFDLSAMLKELTCIDEYVPYDTVVEEARDKYRIFFHGRSLFNETGNSRDGMGENYGSTAPIQPTELVELMPVTTAAVRALGAQRTRIMNLKAHGSLDWHRHYSQPADYLTVHLPLIMPSKFYYAVTPRGNIDRNRPYLPIDEAKVYRAKYPVGKATVFNSYHYHNVFNESEQDRISIMMYCDLQYAPFRELVVKAVADYQGALIPMPLLPLYPTNA